MMTFLQRSAPWAKIIIIIPSSVEQAENENILSYKNENEILPLLKENSFHFALVVGVDKSILDKKIPYHTQLTLF